MAFCFLTRLIAGLRRLVARLEGFGVEGNVREQEQEQEQEQQEQEQEQEQEQVEAAPAAKT